MNYYWLVNTHFNDNDIVYGYVKNDTKFKDEYIYTKSDCKSIDISHLEFEFEKSDPKYFRDIQPNDIDYVLWSDQLKKQFTDSKLNGAHFFKINSTTINSYFPYWYTHLKQVQALDIEGSDAKLNEYNGQEVYSFIKPVLIEKNLKNLDIFRIKEFLPGIYVSEKFVDLFEKYKFTGAEFKQVRTT